MIDRRQFALASTAMLGTALGPPHPAWCEEAKSLQEKRLVKLGLNALARAPELNYFADGHRGASMISAHMMCADNELDEVATARIVELFDLNWAPSKLCEPFPAADPVADAVERVGKALAGGGGVLREVGHDAIFAMHAIKGFRMLPETATAQRVEGVCHLIQAIKPWRDSPPSEDVDPPPFGDSVARFAFHPKRSQPSDRPLSWLRSGICRAHAHLWSVARRAGGDGGRRVGRELPHRISQVRDRNAFGTTIGRTENQRSRAQPTASLGSSLLATTGRTFTRDWARFQIPLCLL
jgi:hypothetical protein